jgi:hypothetical protein
MKTEAKSIIGKTITGVISRPSSGGVPAIMVLQFSDGSCFEFVSPAAQRNITRQSRRQANSAKVLDSLLAAQLNIFPLDGDPNANAALPAAAA